MAIIPLNGVGLESYHGNAIALKMLKVKGMEG
jgi:hypothetical protein